jgi:hypothetical protein
MWTFGVTIVSTRASALTAIWIGVCFCSLVALLAIALGILTRRAQRGGGSRLDSSSLISCSVGRLQCSTA